MNQTGKFGYTEANDIPILEMPYVNNDMSMVILLPKKVDGVKDLEKELVSDQSRPTGLPKIHKREVQVFFPRFKMTRRFGLARYLVRWDAGRVFGKADFSGMQAASASSYRPWFTRHTSMITKREPRRRQPPALLEIDLDPRTLAGFRADHPFIFLIRDNQDGQYPVPGPTGKSGFER